MRELKNDPFYEQINLYKGCIIDYCLIGNDVPHQGYRSHKDSVLFAMCKVIERDLDYRLKAELVFQQGRLENIDEEPFSWSVDIGKAKGKTVDSVSFLRVPDIIEKNNYGKLRYDCETRVPKRGEGIPYWYAFWKTPHKTRYGKDDFDKINRTLFPNGAESLEVYEWTTDWSNYFDDGHEWWGSACWSVYDRSLRRYVVIMASTTD